MSAASTGATTSEQVNKHALHTRIRLVCVVVVVVVLLFLVRSSYQLQGEKVV